MSDGLTDLRKGISREAVSNSARGEPVTVALAGPAERIEAIPSLAALRIQVFRAWPYLYEGDAVYEAQYLDKYVHSPRAGVILARQGSRIVGASTCLPLADETGNVRTSFTERGWDPADFFYFGESVLLPEYRGRGIGVAFFDEREAHARKMSSCRYACFCSVVRHDNHPSQPAGTVPLDAFWTRRGYTRRPDLTCEMTWTDVGDTLETAKTLVFWIKPLAGGALP